MMKDMMSATISDIKENIAAGANPASTGSRLINVHPENTIEAIAAESAPDNPGANRVITAKATISIVR
ncbi:MAG: hypothetical protein ACI3ZN_01670 [Candidatus Cryptobacteroides sp.]